MLSVLRRLLPGMVLIVGASGALLLSDWSQRTSGRERLRRVAIMQCASQSVLDDGVQGIKEALIEAGFVPGKDIVIRQFNPENDIGTANAIAKQITDGEFEMVFTVSTVCLQVVANANHAGKTVHVFGLVTDPFAAGVGIDRDNPLRHPPHLVGVGSFQPVAEAFRLAKKLFPGLASVGAVWNTAEASSEACMVKAREVSRDLRITLMEAHVDNSSGVFEAATALTGRGAQALWVGCDVTVNVALESVLGAGKRVRIPVFTNQPPNAMRGALFDLGANYVEVGRMVGELGAKILRGADPSSIPVRNAVPEKLIVNRKALNGLKDPWTLPGEVLARADVVVDENGVREKQLAKIPRPPEGRVFKMGLVYFAPEPGAEACMKGLFDGLTDLGFVEGRNLLVRRAHAQGEISNIPSILLDFANRDLDLITPMTTPVLTAAGTVVKRKPVVFTYVYDPIAAGVGKTTTDHLPNFTGVGSFPPVDDTVDVIQKLVPHVKSVGTLYNSSEANSRKVMSVARDLFKKRGIKLEEVTITNTSDVFLATQVVATRGIQAIWITGDNTALQAFEGIVKVATNMRLPLIINDPEFLERGALAGVGIGWQNTCGAAARAVARVLLGESPKEMPFQNIAVKYIVLNHEMARKLGITFPKDLLKEATAG